MLKDALEGDCNGRYGSKQVQTLLAKRAVLTLLGAGLAIVLLSCSATTPTANSSGLARAESSVETIPSDGVVLYYLHINVRCTTCRDMERYAREMVMDRFGSHVVAGGLHWMPVDVQQPANRHFLSDFEALTRSLVLERREGGRTLRYKVLHEAWLHLIDRGEFDGYLSSEIDEFLAQSGASSSRGKERPPDSLSVGEQAKGELR